MSVVPAPADLQAYLTAKHAYERLVDVQHPGHVHGAPWPAEVTEALAGVDRLKEAGGAAGPAGPLCCQWYGYLHEPAFSVAGCQWLGVQL